MNQPNERVVSISSEEAIRPRVLFIGSLIGATGGIPQYQRDVVEAVRSAGLLDDVLDLQLDGSRRTVVRAFLRGIGRVLRRRPRLVILSHISLSPLGAIARLFGIPFVVIAYGREIWGPASWIRRRTMRLAAGVWPISEFTRREVEVRFPGVPVSDPLGGRIPEVPLSGTTGSHRAFTVLTVAAAKPPAYKGIDTCIEAVVSVARHDPIEYRIVGARLDHDALADIISEFGAESLVTIVGEASDDQIDDEYRRADVVVLLSRFRAGKAPMGEGLGLVLLEASARGLPVIGSRVGGTTDAVVDGVTGFLLPAGDSAQLAAALTRLVQDSSLRSTLGEAGRRWVQAEHGVAAFDARVDRLAFAASSRQG